MAEVTDDSFGSRGAGLLDDAAIADGDLRDRVARLIRDTIGCTVAVQLVPPGAAPRCEGGKIQRVTDLREPAGASGTT